MLMVKCPLPPVEQWEDVIRDRLVFLVKQGLLPQLFLPACSLPADPQQQGEGACLPHSLTPVSMTAHG